MVCVEVRCIWGVWLGGVGIVEGAKPSLMAGMSRVDN